MIKQTAVQFVVNELEKLTGLNLKDEPIIEKALEMEKEQICDAFYYGVDVDSFCVNNPYKVAENYYKETHETQND